jgi:beta-glucosidase/6-phospho-beta-glucosidase/beta-galactosidase
LIGPVSDSSWLHAVPWGFINALVYIQTTYGDPEIFVTENGAPTPGSGFAAPADAVKDTYTVQYYQVTHLTIKCPPLLTHTC